MNSFRQFYSDNRDKLFGYLLRKSGSVHLAADLVQEAFTRYLERYRNQTGNVPLLFTIARNGFYDHVREAARHKDAASESSMMGMAADEERLYLVKEESKRVLAAIQKLNEEDRDVLSLVVASGLNYREIAAIKGCSEAAVKVRVHRARQQLRNILPVEQA